MRMRLLKKSKSYSYPKSSKVNRAGIRWKECVHNWRGLADEAKKKEKKINRHAVTTNCEESAEVIVPA